VGAIINPRINYRDHRKIVVIDGTIGYIGGDNLADEYIGRLVKYGKWRDNAMRLCGDAVYSLQLVFAESWFLACGEKIELKPFVSNKGESDGFVMPFGDGPTNPYNPAHTLFESLVSSASKYLYISTPYFIVDNAFINLLCNSARSGVDVRLLVPHKPDKKIIFAITRGHYGELLKAGVKIYEYTPGFNHAKNFIVDDKYAFIGTVNCDYRSLMLHFENGAYLAHNSQIVEMRKDFLSAVEKSEIITLEKWKNRPLLTKITEVALSFLAPLL
jgi:cardiolipin synthase